MRTCAVDTTTSTSTTGPRQPPKQEHRTRRGQGRHEQHAARPLGIAHAVAQGTDKDAAGDGRGVEQREQQRARPRRQCQLLCRVAGQVRRGQEVAQRLQHVPRLQRPEAARAEQRERVEASTALAA